MLWLPDMSTGATSVFTFGGVTGSVAGCADILRRSRISFAACLGVVGGAVHAMAFAPYVLDSTGANDRPWIGALSSAQLGLRLVGPLVAAIGFEVTAPLIRYTFAVENDGWPTVVFQQWPVGVGGWLGLGVALP
jgi:hypothetical protein